MTDIPVGSRNRHKIICLIGHHLICRTTIYQDGTVTPIEIKKSSAPKNAVKNFSVLAPIEQDPSEEDIFSGAAHLKVKIGTGAVVCMPVDLIPVDKKNWYVPAWLI